MSLNGSMGKSGKLQGSIGSGATVTGDVKTGYKVSTSIYAPGTIQGKSAYEIAILNGFEGTVDEWLASLKGEPGEDGHTPVKGIDYFDGVNGKDGYTPVKGIDYFDGKDGQPGAKGEPGEKGDPGEKGEPGEQGPAGEKGEKGDTGSKGDKGDKGDAGYTPVKGVDYFDGKDGKDGQPGSPGKDGANGEDGFSPTIEVASITGGHRLTITDVNSTKVVDVMDGAGGTGGGENGKDGRGIVSVRRTSGNGTAGTTDTYTITYTDNTTSTFTVYNGKDGVNGQDGKDGSNGKDGVSATHSWNGTTLTITSASGTSSADLKGAKGDKGDKGDTGEKGEQGPAGADGEKGETGEKGEDGKNADVYVLIGHMNKVKNGSVSLNLYKNGQSCTETLYLRSLVSSGGGDWREHGTSTGSFKTSKTWSFGGTDAGMAWRCEIYSDSTKANLLASCFIYGGATGATGADGKDGNDYVLTDADKTEIAEQAAALVPTGGEALEMMVVEFDGNLATWLPGQIYDHVCAGGTAVWDMGDRYYGYATLTTISESNAMFTFISAEEGLMKQLCVFDDGSAEVFELWLIQ